MGQVKYCPHILPLGNISCRAFVFVVAHFGVFAMRLVSPAVVVCMIHINIPADSVVFPRMRIAGFIWHLFSFVCCLADWFYFPKNVGIVSPPIGLSPYISISNNNYILAYNYNFVKLFYRARTIPN